MARCLWSSRLAVVMVSLALLSASCAEAQLKGLGAWLPGLGSSCETVAKGRLPVVKADNFRPEPATNVTTSLAPGRCHLWTIDPAALAQAGCGNITSETAIHLEVWKLDRDAVPSSSTSAPVTAGALPEGWSVVVSDDDTPATNVFVLAARGTPPGIAVTQSGTTVFSPRLHDDTLGLANGTFWDQYASLYHRPYSHLLLPLPLDGAGGAAQSAAAATASSSSSGPPYGVLQVVTDGGGAPAGNATNDPGAWYVLVANLDAAGQGLDGYAMRATCLPYDGNKAKLPCPTPQPQGPQCNGHGTCELDDGRQDALLCRYCNCTDGWGGAACTRQLKQVALNGGWLQVDLEPGEWFYGEVQLPAPNSTFLDAELLVSMERTVERTLGGDPLLFLKPFDTPDRNEPTLDSQGNDLDAYADLPSFMLQQNRHFLLRRLRGPPASIQRRWHLAVYNNDASEPARVRLQAQYLDLSVQALACPLDCSGRGICEDPYKLLQGDGVGDDLGGGAGVAGGAGDGSAAAAAVVAAAGGGSMAAVAAAAGGGGGSGSVETATANVGAAGAALLPLARGMGFHCQCNQGYGGVLCEGRQQNLTIGSGTQQSISPTTLEPGGWDYYLLTLGSDFDYGSDTVGIAWTLIEEGRGAGTAAAVQRNHTNAFLSFDEGIYPRQLPLFNQPLVSPRSWLIGYAALAARRNPPLPLQVKGSDLTPGITYVLSVFNSDYVFREPYSYTLQVYVPSDRPLLLHPYVSIALGITAAALLCLIMTVCRRLLSRYGAPWVRRSGNGDGGAIGSDGVGNGARVRVPRQRGVPVELFSMFPTYVYGAKRRAEAAVAGKDVRPTKDVETGDASIDGSSSSSGVSSGAVGGAAGGKAVGTAAPSSAAAGAAAMASNADAAGHAPEGSSAAPASTQSLPPPAAQGQPSVQALQSAQSQHTLHSAELPPLLQAPPLAASEHPLQPGQQTLLKQTQAGLTQQQAPEHQAAEDELPCCTVCLCEYADTDMVRQLPCGHEFHQPCVDKWMRSHSTCPICRLPLCPGRSHDEASDTAGDAGGGLAVAGDGQRGGVMRVSGVRVADGGSRSSRRASRAAMAVQAALLTRALRNGAAFASGGRAAAAAVAPAGGGRATATDAAARGGAAGTAAATSGAAAGRGGRAMSSAAGGDGGGAVTAARVDQGAMRIGQPGPAGDAGPRAAHQSGQRAHRRLHRQHSHTRSRSGGGGSASASSSAAGSGAAIGQGPAVESGRQIVQTLGVTAMPVPASEQAASAAAPAAAGQQAANRAAAEAHGASASGIEMAARV